MPRHCARCKAGSHAGFTLVELLVVLAIIAILAGLLLSSLQAAQAQAKRIHCTSNIRQLGVALQIYLGEYQCYPLASDGNGLGFWQHELPIQAAESVLYCPQLQKASPDFLEFFPTNLFIFPHYGYNVSGGERINPPPQNPGLGGSFVWTGLGTGHYVAAGETWVSHPSQMIALGDGITLFPPPSVAVELSPADPLYNIYPFILQPQGYPGVNSNHAGGANLVLCDGHVEYNRQAWWLSPADTSKRLWNHDNQSHPEFQ